MKLKNLHICFYVLLLQTHLHPDDQLEAVNRNIEILDHLSVCDDLCWHENRRNSA